MKLCDEGVCNLVEAIVGRAKLDYRRALKHPDSLHKYENVIALESFFRSEWFQMLTNGAMSGDEAIRMARREKYA